MRNKREVITPYRGPIHSQGSPDYHTLYEQAEREREWISTEDRMPEDGQRVAFVPNFDPESRHHYMNSMVLGGVFRGGEFPAFCFPGQCMSARCWMPLAEPPGDTED